MMHGQKKHQITTYRVRKINILLFLKAESVQEPRNSKNTRIIVGLCLYELN